jgi:hypothetical protein
MGPTVGRRTSASRIRVSASRTQTVGRMWGYAMGVPLSAYVPCAVTAVARALTSPALADGGRRTWTVNVAVSARRVSVNGNAGGVGHPSIATRISPRVVSAALCRTVTVSASGSVSRSDHTTVSGSSAISTGATTRTGCRTSPTA